MRVPPSAVAAAIVTFNRRDVLRQALSAMQEQSRPLDEIIVIDNASTDGTADMVTVDFPAVRLVQLAENTGAAGGFAAGMNEAVARGHDWVWVFNDDDIPEPDALATMLAALDELPDRTGVLGCSRRGADGSGHPLGARWNHRHVLVEAADPAAAPIALDVVTLSGTLVSAEVVRELGVPKSEYFMMIEDLEYCLRVRRAGWHIYVVPRPLATSFNLGSRGASPPWRGYYQTRNQLAMTLEHRSLRELYWWLVRTTKFCLGAVRGGDRPVTRIRLRLLGAWHAIRGVSGRTVSPTSAAAS